MDWQRITQRLDALPGDLGLYYHNLSTRERFRYRADRLFEAASVIKLPVYAAVMKLNAEGRADWQEKLLCREEDLLPSCGALRFLPCPAAWELGSLCALMISLSDNTATNLILRRFGLETLNEQFRLMGLEKTHLERLLFDAQAAGQGRENRFAPEELGELLARIARRDFLSPERSRRIEALLLEQQINHKIPGYLPEDVPVAHKTGEDSGITNDVGLVFARQPFVLCFAANNSDVPAAERFLREISLELYRHCS